MFRGEPFPYERGVATDWDQHLYESGYIKRLETMVLVKDAPKMPPVSIPTRHDENPRSVKNENMVTWGGAIVGAAVGILIGLGLGTLR